MLLGLASIVSFNPGIAKKFRYSSAGSSTEESNRELEKRGGWPRLAGSVTSYFTALSQK
jgi:hypothetical protein